jgi:hypothetical protein
MYLLTEKEKNRISISDAIQSQTFNFLDSQLPWGETYGFPKKKFGTLISAV